MNCRFAIWVVAGFLLCSCGRSPIPSIAESHVTANVPDAKDFRALLIRDLTAYLKPAYGDKLAVDYVLLRDRATQVGVAYPKFYVWLTATSSDRTVIEGVARVAAIDKKEFQVTDFVSRSDIVSHPDSLARIFPQALIGMIHTKAGVKK